MFVVQLSKSCGEGDSRFTGLPGVADGGPLAVLGDGRTKHYFSAFFL